MLNTDKAYGHEIIFEHHYGLFGMSATRDLQMESFRRTATDTLRVFVEHTVW